MSRYIDADALAEKFHKMGLGENSLIERLFADGVYAVLDTFPTADVEPVRHGHWIYIGTDKTDNIFTCSECGRRIKNPCYETTAIVKIRFPYCNCGAKMDGKEAIIR